MSVRRLLVASALAALAAPAAAYVRSTSDTTGAPLFWPMPAVPFHVSQHQPYSPSPTCEPTATRDPALDAVTAAYAAWRQGCSQLQFGYAGRIDEIRVGLDGTDENLVVFRHGFCSADPRAAADPCMTNPDVDCGGTYNCFEDHGAGDRNVVALTSVLYDPSSGRIFDADIEVNGWDGDAAGAALSSGPGGPAQGWYFTCDKQAGWGECARYGDAGCYYIDLQNTVTHEVGHVLGLAHVCEQGTCSPDLQALTMYPATSPGDTDKRSLAADDVAGICAIYPARSSGGCASSGGAATLVAALLAAAALLRRRRAS